MVRMNPTSCKSTAGDSRLANNPKLNVVMTYEDFVTGIDAVRTLSRLAQRTGHLDEFGTQNVWNFQTLADPTLRNIAAAEAAKADMVVIAAHGPGRLPIAVMHWIELWLGQRGTSRAALVALLDGVNGDTREPLPIETYLKQRARRAGLDFFVQEVGERQAVDDYDFAMIAEKAEQTSEALEQIMHRPRGSRAGASTSEIALVRGVTIGSRADLALASRPAYRY
jgi:hypothetical protein